jgi:hypothetical protein
LNSTQADRERRLDREPHPRVDRAGDGAAPPPPPFSPRRNPPASPAARAPPPPPAARRTASSPSPYAQSRRRADVAGPRPALSVDER